MSDINIVLIFVVELVGESVHTKEKREHTQTVLNTTDSYYFLLFSTQHLTEALLLFYVHIFLSASRFDSFFSPLTFLVKKMSFFFVP